VSTTLTTFHLTAQDHFQCLAGNCPASCCSGWQIEIEPELVERWKTLPDPVDRERFPSLVRSVSDGTTSKLFITGSDQPRCGLLNAENLCEAHLRYGVDSTPLTCRSFPRMLEQAGAIRMESASPACPVIAQRVVVDDGTRPLFVRTPPSESSAPLQTEERIRHGLIELLSRLMQAEAIPVGIRLYWLAEQAGRWASDPGSISLLLAKLDSSDEVLLNDLASLAAHYTAGTLHADPVIAGSFWNTLYQMGHARRLLPAISRNSSALRAGLQGLPADRRGFYAAVHDEVINLRGRTSLMEQDWYPRAASRLLHLHLLNAGFPWQPSLDDYRVSFVHAVMYSALTRLSAWLDADTRPVSADLFVTAVYRTGRAFGHNTLIPAQINANPALLELDRYHAAFLDL